LVNNVGGTETKAGVFEVLSDEDWQRILEVNLLAAVRLDRAFLPGMIERKSGVVIHISSVQHRLPFSNSTLAYAAALFSPSFEFTQNATHRPVVCSTHCG
jgi:NAD(P)-dependent dehydrogenase (short-subunit alcohol dehydrogenase family)